MSAVAPHVVASGRRQLLTPPDRANVLDFTSSLYLGMHHPSRSLPHWERLTSGKPAALEIPKIAERIAVSLADLQGCEQAVLSPSTLHLFFDLFEALRHDGIIVYADSAAYPIALWGAERAAARGVPLRRIRHYQPEAARVAIEADAGSGRRPIILADGFCPKCGRPAPLRAYLQCVVPYGGYVVLDDTQALGIWGSSPSPRNPYGIGGGGSVRLHALRSPHVFLGSSLAKPFGVPVAALSGRARLIARFLECSETRVHSSPPSIAVLHAAEQALAINTRHGDRLRRRLAGRVAQFADNLRGIGLRASKSPFPVQIVALPEPGDAVHLQRRLWAGAGVRTVVLRRHAPAPPSLAFVISAAHSAEDIDRAATALHRAFQDKTV